MAMVPGHMPPTTAATVIQLPEHAIRAIPPWGGSATPVIPPEEGASRATRQGGFAGLGTASAPVDAGSCFH